MFIGGFQVLTAIKTGGLREKRLVTDEYTGERIFYGNQPNARHLHGLDKTADVDHVTPIAKIRE